MDYSLLVGVDKQRHELVFGIIDYLRRYTFDKMLETRIKSSLLVPKNSSPTVIPPNEYKERFRKFTIKYFFTVPDSWISHPTSEECVVSVPDWISHPSSEECVGSCKLYGQKDSKDTQIPDTKVPDHQAGSSSLP
jgi:Phosphatidylinositol-4-phosphate 5-Kinase